MLRSGRRGPAGGHRAQRAPVQARRDGRRRPRGGARDAPGQVAVHAVDARGGRRAQEALPRPRGRPRRRIPPGTPARLPQVPDGVVRRRRDPRVPPLRRRAGRSGGESLRPSRLPGALPRPRLLARSGPEDGSEIQPAARAGDPRGVGAHGGAGEGRRGVRLVRSLPIDGVGGGRRVPQAVRGVRRDALLQQAVPARALGGA